MAGVRISGGTAAEIADSIRDLLGAGDLRPGDPVPPIRDLAQQLGVHRNTVAMAYRTLVGAGLAETRGRGGTHIRALPRFDADPPPHRQADQHRPGPDLVDLSSGNPDPALLPDVAAAVARMDYRTALYGSPTVHPHLAEWALDTMTSFADRPPSISVTHGAVDAVDRLLGAHLTRGDLVALEDPCFYASEGTVRVNGFRAAPVDLDTAGMRTDSLRTALDAGARAVIVTSRAHNPTGVSLTAERAAELRELLAGYPHVLVIEDDHFSAVSRRPFHRVTPSTTRHWALVRSVAKFLGPDIRVAAVASDPTTAELLGTRLRPGATWVSHLLQQVAADLLTAPDTPELFHRARDAYSRRADLLRDALAAVGIDTPFPTDGFNVWIPVPRDPVPVVAALRDAGWSVRDGSSFRTRSGDGRHGIRATASRITAREAEAFAAVVAEVLR